MKYVAFLRGINVGGNSLVKMSELREAFESLGYKNVVTLLNSGNVCFETSEADAVVIRQSIETRLAKKFGRSISVIVRTDEQIYSLISADPFHGITVTPETRLYVTFLAEPLPLDANETGSGFGWKILQITRDCICSVATLSAAVQTTDLMKFLDEKFGKALTTRNWNTVLRVEKALAGR